MGSEARIVLTPLRIDGVKAASHRRLERDNERESEWVLAKGVCQAGSSQDQINPRWRRDPVVDMLLGPGSRGDGGLSMFYIAERDGSWRDKV